ncbi:hypothetical protein GCM10023184_29970 [Flaviaesturariibacter amylovorans]|uniref:Uncharacterized protein n=1 Tax=Flaviaesturariibacter amylovorans TaxID=1084520 RepID=A0ABP8H7A0_9BACT
MCGQGDAPTDLLRTEARQQSLLQQYADLVPMEQEQVIIGQRQVPHPHPARQTPDPPETDRAIARIPLSVIKQSLPGPLF